MKRKTQTILLLITLAIVTYAWDIFGMLSLLPSSHSLEKPKYSKSDLPSSSSRRSRGLAAAKPLLQTSTNESWMQPRWPTKSLEAEEEEQFNKFHSPKKRTKTVGNQTTTESWHPKALKLQKKKNKSQAGDIEEYLPAAIEVPVDPTKYLLPITIGNQGPNNQLQAVKFCIAVALMHNYTIVVPPFFEHQTNQDLIPKQRTFEDTIDWRTLRKIIPVVSVRGFHTACGGEADKVMVGTDYGKNSQDEEERKELTIYEAEMVKIFANLSNLTIPSILETSDQIMHLPEGSPQHFIHLDDYIRKYPSAFNSTSRCNVFVHAYGMLGRFGYRHFNPVFSQYFLRAEYIRTVANQFITQYLGTKFLCLHWRFDTEWVQFWCNQYYEHGKYFCPILQSTPISEVIRRFVILLQQYHLNVVYYASPMDASQDHVLRHLRGTLQYVFNRDSIVNSAVPGRVWFQNDNYRMSLLEQEICKRSDFFIGSELSSWSDMVIEDRQGVSSLRVTDMLR